MSPILATALAAAASSRAFACPPARKRQATPARFAIQLDQLQPTRSPSARVVAPVRPPVPLRTPATPRGDASPTTFRRAVPAEIQLPALVIKPTLATEAATASSALPRTERPATTAPSARAGINARAACAYLLDRSIAEPTAAATRPRINASARVVRSERLASPAAPGIPAMRARYATPIAARRLST